MPSLFETGKIVLYQTGERDPNQFMVWFDQSPLQIARVSNNCKLYYIKKSQFNDGARVGDGVQFEER